MTGVWVTAGFILAMCIAVPAVWWLRDRQQEAAWRLEGDQLAVAARGRHRAPKPRPAAVTVRADRAIRPAVTEHAPPWDPAPAAVIEPAAVTQGPPEPGPDAYWLAAGTYSRATGQVRTVRVELLPPVEALLGHATTTAAVESMSAQWHSVESIFNGHHARQVRALTDGAS